MTTMMQTNKCKRDLHLLFILLGIIRKKEKEDEGNKATTVVTGHCLKKALSLELQSQHCLLKAMIIFHGLQLPNC